MVLPIIPTEYQKLLLKFDIMFFDPGKINVIGFDADNGKTVYFHREVQVDYPGTFTFDFPMPLTPNNLRIKFSASNENNYKVVSVKCDYLPQMPLPMYPEDIKILKFLEWFSVNASVLAPGAYRWPKTKMWINYMNDIIDEKLGKISTPARIDHDTAELQAARSQMKNFSVPIIMAIVCHEWTHWKRDTQNETECDLEACRICLGLGFPKSEIAYAFANIFHDSKTNIYRINKIMNYIENFRYTA